MKRRSLLLTLDMLDRLLEEIKLKYGCKRNRAVRCAIPATEAYCAIPQCESETVARWALPFA